MEKDNLKSITVEVSKECWKRIKILSVQRDVTFSTQVRELLERSVSKKIIEEVKINE